MGNKIAELNDACRKSLKSGYPAFKTPSVNSLPLATQQAILERVIDFLDFTEDNDPYGEHDFGSFEHEDMKIFWKIDYYDKNKKYLSDDPADPDKTTRVLTIMLASDY